MPETTRELTWMAEAAITASLNVLHPITCEELGAPFSGDEGQNVTRADKEQQKCWFWPWAKWAPKSSTSHRI